ncbi:hypothetical protein JCM19237_2010 [Photobacterium aphoticum]|uniref:NADPH-dependent FMN reductase-like domain-containing protein n=1 Tax=Photobacterium aphoticum TaxID=754436 RepID=A0A090QPV8_9GAMM|nr:hypothetical protein JCM19237_2010 [Photobacterium aphoticum]
MKILAFGATNSKRSINKMLAFYAAQQIENAEINLIDLNDYEMPIYSEEREEEHGIHALAHQFFNDISEADLIIVSFAEYNGTYTAAYKNIFDWASRIDMKLFQNKPVLMLATSPGPGGAQSVLAAAIASAPYIAADVIGAISLENFYEHFDIDKGVVTHSAFNQALTHAFNTLGESAVRTSQ